MQQKPANKHKAKSEATRTALLESAERIFFRDGFERAQIDQIAAEAGRTSGAVYATFQNKEHLFLSVLENRMLEIAALCKDVLSKEAGHDPKLRLKAFRKFYAMLYRPDWAILHLEFKLYGLRHPESIETLKQISRRTWDDSLYEGLLHSRKYSGQSSIQCRIAALTAIASAIVLDMHWEPDVMKLKQAKLILGEVFDGLFREAIPHQPTRKAAAPSPAKTGKTKLTSR